jgi:putative nucleotidyltransferase with HDIG domain
VIGVDKQSSVEALFEREVDTVVWSLADDEIRRLFKRSLYREILEDAAIQRLSRISFLGAIDHVMPRQKTLRTVSNSRFQHTIGVARLALRYARNADLNEHDEQLVVTSALLHDIGHAPLSHSLESVFQSHFNLNHHDAGNQVIRGESVLGKGILEALRAAGIDPDEVMELIAGKHPGIVAHPFGGPMNIDTFEGILRCRLYMRLPVSPIPEALVDGLVSFGPPCQSRFDMFWGIKHAVYGGLINGAGGILADALARIYMIDRISSFSRNDFFLCEKLLLKAHPGLAGLFRTAKKRLRSNVNGETVIYNKREFYKNDSHKIGSYRDLSCRYLQRKLPARMRVPGFSGEITKSEQRGLFDSACEQ